jgi:hypothetical protein
MTINQMADRIADNLFAMGKAGQIKSINIETIRLAIAATPQRFDHDKLEKAICRRVINKVG